MITKVWHLPAFVGAILLLSGCRTAPSGVERGPHGTVAYDVLVEASPPGARIEANGKVVGNTPIHLKVFGDKDGTFHDFGSYYYAIRGLPMTTNQFVQTALFRTGRWFTPEDIIPQRIYFDMSVRPPTAPAQRVYVIPGYAPPPYYGPAPFYGPGVRFYFGPGVY
jgi:hypothetical protein